MNIRGFCPMGCGQTLFAGGDNCVTCGNIDCPAPGAVTILLEDPEVEHTVRLDERGFSLQHPLRERLNGELFNCTLHQRLREEGVMPVQEVGSYRVIEDGNALVFTRLA